MPAFLRLLRLLLIDPSISHIRIRLACLAYLAILVLGSIPGARAGIGHFASGVVLHSLAYAGLTLLIFCGINGSAARRAVASVLAIAAMGAADEFVQSFFSYRGATVGDWLVDCAAALVSAAVLYLLWPRVTLAPARVP
ncbi:VanZ family protein [Massilia sp. DWR3-1-1]|uniref:VanZ family protein n=1 Tax=Massilia sp. DWR3-1-1 TaxID=2804559 RepID=UPI003CF4CA85